MTVRPLRVVPVGTRPPTIEAGVVNELMAAGLSQSELLSQQMAMLQIQQEQQQQQPRSPVSPRSREANQNEKLDRENHVVVELVTEEEWFALKDTGCWPKQVTSFAMSVTVQDSGRFSFSTLPCRDCDPTGSRFTSCAEVKYRRKRWEPKSVEQRRIPTVEY